ncbi:hypothetical protein [Nannocystis pusilla]|uniref:hypothetical protein n=1 Tax=Nannocystis pusilla TaxID=889268 RepID=UPI003B7E7C1A
MRGRVRASSGRARLVLDLPAPALRLCEADARGHTPIAAAPSSPAPPVVERVDASAQPLFAAAQVEGCSSCAR